MVSLSWVEFVPISLCIWCLCSAIYSFLDLPFLAGAFFFCVAPVLGVDFSFNRWWRMTANVTMTMLTISSAIQTMHAFWSTAYKIYVSHSEITMDTIDRATWIFTATQCLDKPANKNKSRKKRVSNKKTNRANKLNGFKHLW